MTNSKQIVIIVFSLILNLNLMSQEKLVYVGDPMCSWCYGFSNELHMVVNHIQKTADFELVMGGLRPYNTQKMSELKSFLTEHWQHVNEASGLEFNYSILNRDDIAYDTEPPSRAVLAVRKMKPELEFEFFKSVQKLFYSENKNLNDANSYVELVASLGLDTEEFLKLYHSDEMKLMVKKDFERANDLNARSFPTLLYYKDGKYTAVAIGYDSAENIIAKIKKVATE